VRQDVVSQAARQLSAVVSKRVGVAVGIWGEPGIGKTHAAHAVLERVPCRHLSLHATTDSAQIVAALPKARTLPAWAQAQLTRLERGEPLEMGTFVATLAAALGALAPFVLHLEDVHEANPERLELIQSLARTVTRTRGVALLATSRAELPEPFRNHRLEPLSGEETAALVQQELKAEAPRDGLEWLFGRTHGNPLFTLEFARYLTRQGFLWSDGQRWHWRTPPEDFMPITVDALISQLTLGLTANPETQAALEARAILPGELSPEILEAIWAEVAGLSRETLLVAATSLEQSGVFNGERFAHPLFAEVFRRNVPAARRTDYAARAVRALEAFDPVLAAGYFIEAKLEPSEASALLERAARRLYESNDEVHAARLLAQAAECSSGERQAVLALEAARHLRGRDVPESERLARIAIQSPTLRREATFLCATAIQGNGRHDEAWNLLESLPENERDGLEWWQMRLEFHAAAGQNRETVCLWDEHLDFQKSASGWSLYKVISALIHLSETERAHELIDATLQRSDLSPRERAQMLDRRNFMLAREAQYEVVERNHTEILGLMDEHAFPSDCAVYYANRSVARTRLGKHLEAEADAASACQLALSTGSLSYYAIFPTTLALAQIHLGKYEQAERVLLEATSLAQLHNPSALWDCYGHLSFLYLRWNAPHGPMLARRYARLSLEIARGLERTDALVSALEDCVRAELGCDAFETGLEYARELERVAARTGLEEDLTASTTLMGRTLGAMGNREAIPYLRRAAELLESHGQHEEALMQELKIDRLENNLEAARAKLVWFEQNGHARHAARVIKHFPELGNGPVPQALAPRPAARLLVLGPVTLERDGVSVPTRARKRLEILTYLLETRIAGRTEASALELVDALYPDTPEPEAKKALKQLVYLNRSGLGADSLISTPSGYALGAVSSDAEDFLQTGDSDLWRGPYLGRLIDGWHQGVRDAMTLALQTKVESLLGSNPLEAARLGLILTEMEPLDAEALRMTVQSLEQSGNLRAARSVYREGRTRLLEMGEILPETIDGFLTP
jgi:tetratricopeptide (TPR) repeat protein